MKKNTKTKKNTNTKRFVVGEVEERYYFDLDYKIEGDNRERTGFSLGRDAQEAMKNFLTDFSPSHGRISSIGVSACCGEERGRRPHKRIC